MDGFTPSSVETTFTVPYEGDDPGLTAAEIELLEADGPWYAQKVVGNTWQADWVSQDAVDVDVVDWGDNIESVDAFVRRPYRLEVVLFDNTLAETMTGYKMAMMETRSPDEIQGNGHGHLRGHVRDRDLEQAEAGHPGYRGRRSGGTDLGRGHEPLVGNGTVALPATPIGFAPELNVAGKYIYGASTGGWKPTAAGAYRVTFYIPSDSFVNLRGATIPVPVEETVVAEAEEGGGATPVILPDFNLTYVDITVQPRNR